MTIEREGERDERRKVLDFYSDESLKEKISR
jgi:hypothetical protein